MSSNEPQVVSENLLLCPVTNCNKLCKGKVSLSVHLTRSHTIDERNAIVQGTSSAPSSSAASSSTPSSTPVVVPTLTKEAQLLSYLQKLRSSVRIVKRLPKAARFHASVEFTKLLESCLNNFESFDCWCKLLSFPYVAFRSPDRKDKATSKLSLATMVKRNLKLWVDIKNLSFDEFFTRAVPDRQSQKPRKKKFNAEANRIKKVQSKLNDGDIRGAIRILSSDDTFAPINMDSYVKLLEKHPAAELVVNFDDSVLPPIVTVTESEVKIAVWKFENGTVGGMDGLRPQHLKDMLSVETSGNGNLMLISLTSFCDLLLNGKVPDIIIPILYGASLCGLNKKDNSIRPIAVGTTFRRLVSKIACARISVKLGQNLRPTQFGFGTKGGAEAGAHAARSFINSNHAQIKVLLKLDYRNAFNELERGPMLLSIYQKCPEIYPFMKQCYTLPTKLAFGEFEILSQRGCQQGDPCGPAAFCLSIQDMVSMLESELNIWFLDDGTLGGPPDVVLRDLRKIIELSSRLGLSLNFSKCEVMILGTENKQEVFESFNDVAPGVLLKENEIDLLGAPLTDSGIPAAINSKLAELKRMVGRLREMNSHQAFFLLRHSFSIPKLTYLLRTTPCWRSMNDLVNYDQYLKSSLEAIINCQLDSKAWIEASLSIKCGGIGIRNVTNLCYSSFLGSYYSTSELWHGILPSYVRPSVDLSIEALSAWYSITDREILANPDCKSQHHWDRYICNALHQQLFESSTSDIDKSRILANVANDSSAWLNALPCSSLGTLLDNQSFRIAVSLRLGLRMCHPHECRCGKMVDEFGRHGLACKFSLGRKVKHETFNDLIKRALTTSGIPAIREPPGCNRSDGKWPDGLTLVPWKNGKPLIWDFTCADTSCQSYINSTRRRAGAAAEARENAKRSKYAPLVDNFYF